jgi:hypothetical protein
MRAISRRLRHLEDRIASGEPRQRWRIVTSGVVGPLNLANSTCRRTLCRNGVLIESVTLDGSRNELSAEELKEFIEGFPIEDIGSR